MRKLDTKKEKTILVSTIKKDILRARKEGIRQTACKQTHKAENLRSTLTTVNNIYAVAQRPSAP